MQTFLPYPSFVASARVLDRQRLGKQRVEAWQILRTLLGISQGWRSHPATRMWVGHSFYLSLYAQAMCREWRDRGYKDSVLEQVLAINELAGGPPPWLGDEEFHRSHRSNLLRKDYEHYSQFFRESTDLPYVWPRGEGAR